MRLTAVRIACLSTLTLILSGCSSSIETIWIEGKVTKSNAKYQVPEGQNLGISLTLTEEAKIGDVKIPAGESFSAEYDPEAGTFTVPGRDGNGIPPGKYKISLEQKLSRESLDEKNAKLSKGQKPFDRDTDMLKGRFGINTPIIRDLKESGPLSIDLDNPSP